MIEPASRAARGLRHLSSNRRSLCDALRSKAAGAIVSAGLAMLYGCADPVADAEQRYEMVKKGGTADEVCAQGRAVTAAYLEAKSPRYTERRVAMNAECEAARMDEERGIFTMPDGSKKKIEVDDLSDRASSYAEPEGAEAINADDPSYQASSNAGEE